MLVAEVKTRVRSLGGIVRKASFSEASLNVIATMEVKRIPRENEPNLRAYLADIDGWKLKQIAWKETPQSQQGYWEVELSHLME